MKSYEEKQKQMEEDIRKFSSIVYKLAVSNTSTISDAEDVFQDVFVKFCIYYNRLNDDEHKEKWLKLTTKHTAINLYKHNKKINFLELDENIATETYFEEEENNYPQNPLKLLRKSYRVVLDLYYFKNLHTKEIAKKLNITTDAVKTRLKRGRKELKDILDNIDKVGSNDYE